MTPTARVHTSAGWVAGVERDGVHSFLGIPYAAPPVGPLRFEAPHPPAPWDGVRVADAFGPACPQPVGVIPGSVPPATGGDCLTVNVYTPDPGAAGLPVLVWIHGGGFVVGHTGDPASQPLGLARRGIVVVAISYRLGVDGFFVLADGGANRGVQDWIAALEWVQENVAAFGGDPDRVTIGGQSAGSAACLTLLADPATEGLFGQVVAMSGVPWYTLDVVEAARESRELARRLGVDPTPDSLGEVPYEALFSVQNDMAPLAGIRMERGPLGMFADLTGIRQWLAPVVEGSVVPADPMVADPSSTASRRPVLIGATAQETDSLMTLSGPELDRSAVLGALVGRGLDEAAALRWLDADPERPPAGALGAALTAMTFGVPVVRVAERRAAAAAPTFVYETAWRPATVLGAVHGIDVPLIFENIDDPGFALMCGGADARQISEDMAGALAGFVAAGDPGWPRYDTTTRSTMCFDVPRSELRPDPAALARQIFQH